jgi:hypothetical protein
MKKPIQYKSPFSVEARPWSDIEKHYEQHPNFLELVRHIKNSGLSERLFAFTSMYKLVVSIYDRIDTFVETLHITFDIEADKWHFEYFARPFKDAEFIRTYSADKGIEKFDNFIKMIKW